MAARPASVATLALIAVMLSASAGTLLSVGKQEPVPPGPIRADQAHPIETVSASEGTLVYLRGGTGISAAALTGTSVLVARGSTGMEAIVEIRDLGTGAIELAFTIPGRAGLRAEVTSLLPFINGEAVAVVVAYRDRAERLVEYAAYMIDHARNRQEQLYLRRADEDLAVEALDWTLANELFLYEYRTAGLGPWMERTVKITIFPRKFVQASDEYRLRGVPSADSTGRFVAFVAGPDETLGQPYYIAIVNLTTREKQTVFERMGTRVVAGTDGPTMTSTRVRWARTIVRSSSSTPITAPTCPRSSCGSILAKTHSVRTRSAWPILGRHWISCSTVTERTCSTAAHETRTMWSRRSTSPRATGGRSLPRRIRLLYLA